MHLTSRSALYEKMAEGWVLLTPNNRLSNQLLREFIQIKGPIHTRPFCFPYTTFLRSEFKRIQHQHSAHSHPLLLNPYQERLLWQHVLQNNGHYSLSEKLIQEVQNAWVFCQLWEVDITPATFWQTPQIQQFQKWHEAFQTALLHLQAITEAQLLPYCLSHREFLTQSSIVWVAFDEFSPQQRALQENITAQGRCNVFYDLENRNHNTTHYAATNGADELDRLCQWLKIQLRDEQSRIAVVVPDLAQKADHLLRRMQKSFSLEQFDISLGKALETFPIIDHALQCLGLNQNTLTHHQGSLLLHSPYLKGAKNEFLARAVVYEECKILNEPKFPLKSFTKALQSHAPLLANLLDNLNTYPEKASPQAWASHFKSRLKLLGFPGEYTLTSENYQYLQRLQLLFDDFEQLALIANALTQTEALSHLQTLARTTIFQIQKSPAPIQILGLLEASGCEFDRVFVLGLTDQCLPQKTKLSPFIPFAIQREKRMPRALPEKELFLAQQCVTRLQKGSQECVFSYPRLIDDIPQLPSPLIQHFPLLMPEPKETSESCVDLVSYEESYLHPILESERFVGGTSLLANQAKCPFRAFAAHRLHAKSALKRQYGLDPALRGQILHKTLEYLWKDLKNQETLLGLSPSALDACIVSAIQKALLPSIEQHPTTMPSLVHTIEHQRLHQLVHATLEWERTRPPFAVKALEAAHTLEIGGLLLKLRIDRLDTVLEDEVWVIDYKTNLPLNKPWQEERPEAPQLLMYALLDENMKALLFLQIKTGQFLCCGISAEEHHLDGLKSIQKDSSWTAEKNAWQQRLNQLALEFQGGQCAPMPQRQSTCLTCEYQNLCRAPFNPLETP